MTIKLNRNRIFIIGIVIIILYLFLNRIDYIFGSDITTGEVIRIKAWHSHGYSRRYSGGSFSAPVIRFSTETSIITFQSIENMDVELGEKVKVIYKISNPTTAEVYSFVGFWLTPLVYCLIPVILLIAAVFSFLTPAQTININLGRFNKKKKEEAKKTIEHKTKTTLKSK